MKAILFGLLGIICLFGGCKRDSATQPAATGSTPNVVQAAPVTTVTSTQKPLVVANSEWLPLLAKYICVAVDEDERPDSTCPSEAQKYIRFHPVSLGPNGQQGVIFEYKKPTFTAGHIYVLELTNKSNAFDALQPVLSEIGSLDSFQISSSTTSDYYDLTRNGPKVEANRYKRTDLGHYEPEVLGAFDPVVDGTAFTAEVVKNECGTVGNPTECVVKEVEVATDPSRLCEDEEDCRPSPIDGYIPPVRTSVALLQLTLKLDDGSYVALGCAFNWPKAEGNGRTEKILYDHAPATTKDFNSSECGEMADSTGRMNEPLLKDSAGKKFLFSRRENVVTYHNGDSDVFENGDYQRLYFLVLGTCGSVHECQSVPRKIHLRQVYWEKDIAPWIWERYVRAKMEDKTLAARQKYLDTPR